MREPYHLTIRFRQQGDSAALDLETDDGSGDVATMALPFGVDLPLVLRALDAAQFPDARHAAARIPSAERDRLAALGLWQTDRLAPDIHAHFGRALLAALCADGAAAAILAQARAAARANGQGLELALRFARQITTFADLPWEALWEDAADGAGLPLLLAQGHRSSCVRYLTLPRPLPPLRPPAAALKLLAVAPHAGIPDDLRRQQRAALTQALAPQIAAGRVALVTPDLPLAIGRLLDLVQQEQPDLLSFYGHGALRDGQGQLQLDGQDGAVEWVSADRLAPLADAGLRLLLLHACRSDQIGDAGLLSGIAPLLSALGLPAVIAMQSYMRVTAATRLQAVVCGGLAAGQSVQDALAWARAALYAEERDAASWYVPTLTIAGRSDAPLFLLAPPADATTADAAGLAALAQGGVRRGARGRREILLGAAGVATVTALVVSGLAPFITGGLTLTHAALTTWLAGLGANALAGWLAGWAGKAGGNLLRGSTADEQAVLGELATNLERRMAADDALSNAVAAFLEKTGAIPTALAALATQLDAQTDLLLDLHTRLTAQQDLLQALRADLRRSDLIQGRLHQLLLQALAAQTDALLRAYAQGTDKLSEEVRAVLAEVRALRDELPRAAPPTPPAPPTSTRTHHQTIDGSTQVGVAIAGDVHGSVTHQTGGHRRRQSHGR